MARTGISIKVANTTLSNPPSVNTNSMLVVCGAVAVSDGDLAFELGKAYMLQSVDGLETLGITQSNNKDVYNQVTDYFSPRGGVNNTGNILWLVGLDATTNVANELVALVRSTVVQGFQYRPRQIAISPANNQEVAAGEIQSAIDALYVEGFRTVAVIGGNLTEATSNILENAYFQDGTIGKYVESVSTPGLATIVNDDGGGLSPYMLRMASYSESVSNYGVYYTLGSDVNGKVFNFKAKVKGTAGQTFKVGGTAVGSTVEIAATGEIQDIEGTFTAASDSQRLFIGLTGSTSGNPNGDPFFIYGAVVVEDPETADFIGLSGGVNLIAQDLRDLSLLGAPMVGVCIVTNRQGDRACVGALCGYMATLTIGTSIGDTLQPQFSSSLYFMDADSSGAWINTPCVEASLSTINLLGDKQYIFARTRPPRNGLWWNDGATCEDAATALSTLEAGRTIASICDDLQSFFTPYINSKVPVNSNGDIRGDYKQTVLQNARANIIEPYIESQDISDARISLEAENNDMVGTRTWKVQVEILAAPTLRWIDGFVFYVSSL